LLHNKIAEQSAAIAAGQDRLRERRRAIARYARLGGAAPRATGGAKAESG